MPRPVREIPWLEQRDNGWFYAHWYDADKRVTHRESLKTKDPAVAATRFGEFLLGGPGRRARRDAGLTVGDVLDLYVRRHLDDTDDKGRSRVVDVVRQKAAIAHLKAYFTDRKAREVGPAECRGYLLARRAQAGKSGGVKDSTVRRELNVLVAASAQARKWGDIEPGDMPRVELPRVEESDKVKWFTKEELQRLFDAAFEESTDLYAFVKMSYYTAARRRSIQDISAEQINLKDGTITLQPEGGRVTKKRRPIVPLYPEIRPLVERLLIDHPRGRLFSTDFYVSFKRACEAVGLEGHPHMLRHSRASHLLQDGADIWKVARLLGDTVATVERVYAHCLPEHLMTESRLSQAK